MTFRKAGKFSYPITKDQVDALVDSPAVGPHWHPDHPRVLVKPSEIPAPSKPGTAEYERQLVEVTRLTKMAKLRQLVDGVSSSDWSSLGPGKRLGDKFLSETMRVKFGVRTVDDGAKFVHKDFPPAALNALCEYLLENGANLRTEIFGERGHEIFTEGTVEIASLIAEAIRAVSPSAFASKWYYGHQRPEEGVHDWVTRKLDVSDLARDELLQNVDAKAVAAAKERFTLYPEGCPNHPSYPAMHGAAAGAGVLFCVLFDLPPELELEVRRLVANVGYFRNFAGVHYDEDTRAGLEVGEMVIERWLPGRLAETFPEIDIEAVRELCAKKRFYWFKEDLDEEI